MTVDPESFARKQMETVTEMESARLYLVGRTKVSRRCVDVMGISMRMGLWLTQKEPMLTILLPIISLKIVPMAAPLSSTPLLSKRK
jgi:hypothetical protein